MYRAASTEVTPQRKKRVCFKSNLTKLNIGETFMASGHVAAKFFLKIKTTKVAKIRNKQNKNKAITRFLCVVIIHNLTCVILSLFNMYMHTRPSLFFLILSLGATIPRL